MSLLCCLKQRIVAGCLPLLVEVFVLNDLCLEKNEGIHAMSKSDLATHKMAPNIISKKWKFDKLPLP